MSPLIDWLAWLGLARLASAWLSRPQTTATTPEEADKTTGAALRAAPVVVAASSGVVAVVVAAADETSHAEARLAKPSQASQSREGLTNCSRKYVFFEKCFAGGSREGASQKMCFFLYFTFS